MNIYHIYIYTQEWFAPTLPLLRLRLLLPLVVVHLMNSWVVWGCYSTFRKHPNLKVSPCQPFSGMLHMFIDFDQCGGSKTCSTKIVLGTYLTSKKTKKNMVSLGKWFTCLATFPYRCYWMPTPSESSNGGWPSCNRCASVFRRTASRTAVAHSAPARHGFIIMVPPNLPLWGIRNAPFSDRPK